MNWSLGIPTRYSDSSACISCYADINIVKKIIVSSKIHSDSVFSKYYGLIVYVWLCDRTENSFTLSWNPFQLPCHEKCLSMMTSSNGNIFRVTAPLCGEFTGPGEFPTQRPMTQNFDVFFYLRLNKRLSKQSRGWWFETPAWSLWRHRNAFLAILTINVFVQC